MSIARVGLVVLTTFFASLSAAASPEDPENQAELIDALEVTYKEVDSVQASFVQVQTSVMGEVSQKGQLRIKRPTMAKWKFEAPNETEMVTDGKTVWVYTPATKQVVETANIGSGDGVMQLLNDLGTLEEHFTVTQFSKTDESYRVNLVPLVAGNYKSIEVVFAQGEYVLQRVTVIDQMDGKIDLTFSDVVYGESMEDSEFVFEIPDGVHVIKGGL